MMKSFKLFVFIFTLLSNNWAMAQSKLCPVTENKKAKKSLTVFLDFNKVDENDAKQASVIINKSKLLSHPVPFHPQPLKGVSTPDWEYLACISPDGDYCFFTRRFEMQPKGSLTPIT